MTLAPYIRLSKGIAGGAGDPAAGSLTPPRPARNDGPV